MIGLPYFNHSILSNGKLQGIIDLGDITAVANNPLDPKFEETLTTLSHEMTHQWGSYVSFRKTDGTSSSALVGKDGTHWSYLLDSSASLMYGNAWQNNGDGTFTSTGVRNSYSALDLYLMGLYDKAQVPPMLLIGNPSVDPAQMPRGGDSVTGTATTVTIDDIIAVEGERIPAADQAQKEFKVGFVLVVPSGTTPSSADLAKVEAIRKAWAGRFAALTGGLGKIVDVAPSLSVAIASPVDGASVSGPDVMVEGFVINTTGKETGVVVNGIPATVSENRFVANSVPLQTGANTITVVATDTGGQTTTATASVTRAAGNYIRLHANIESGLAPLVVSFNIDGTFVISSSNIDRKGPAAAELIPGDSPSRFSVRIPTEGTYTITATVTGPDGTIYQDSVKILALSRVGMDRLLKAKWEGMRTALAATDVEKALSFMESRSLNKYRQIYMLLLDQIPSISVTMQNLKNIDLVDHGAQYTISRPETVNGVSEPIDYEVYFSKDNSGIWKILQY